MSFDGIAAEWPLVPLKRYLSIQGAAGEPEDMQVGLENIEGWTGKHVKTGSKFEGLGTAFQKNDILFGKLRPYLAKAMIAKERGSAVGDLWVLRPSENCSPEFALYQLLDPTMISWINSTTTGAKMPRAEWQTVGSKKVPLPSHSSQGEIVAYLDRETNRIDALIEDKGRFVALLTEKRVAVISHAVTKGLDPAAPMKPSGQDWLGDMPAHWEIDQAKRLFRQMARPVCDDDGIITAFRDGQVCLRTRRRTEGFTMADKEVGYQRIHEGDLVIHTMDAFAGAVGISEDTGKATGEYAVCTPRRDDVNLAYYSHVLRCMAQREYIYVLCPSVRERAPRFRFVRLAPVPLPVPPREEQDRIVEAIDQETIRIDALIAETERSIALLREKRAAEITAAVTGQIDVRNAA